MAEVSSSTRRLQRYRHWIRYQEEPVFAASGVVGHRAVEHASAALDGTRCQAKRCSPVQAARTTTLALRIGRGIKTLLDLLAHCFSASQSTLQGIQIMRYDECWAGQHERT